jgi:integrase
LSGFFDWARDIAKVRDSEKDNPARYVNKKALPKQDKQRHHFPACPIEDLPRFVSILVEPSNFSRAGMALLFAILTWSRHANIARQENSAAQNFAVWDEIHRDAEGGALWIVPAEKMKKPENGAHYVPLSRPALAILDRLEAMGLNHGGAVFITRCGSPFSNSAFTQVIKRIAKIDLERGGSGFIDPAENNRLMTPHGTARRTAKSWAARKGYAEDIREIALHHVKDAYGYQYDNALERRRDMMEAWAAYCMSQCPPDWAELK